MLFTFKDNWDNFVNHGLLNALLSIVVVFVILAIIMTILIVLNKVNISSKKKAKKVEEVKALPTSAPVKKITMEDIKDEDMMVAVLVATIDYRNQVKEDVRLVNVKQIG